MKYFDGENSELSAIMDYQGLHVTSQVGWRKFFSFLLQISLRNSFVIEFIYHFKSPLNFVIADVYFVDKGKNDAASSL